MQKYRRCFWVHKYLLSTYQIWLFHIHSIFSCSAEAYVQQCHDISLSVDYIAKHKLISSFKKTKVNSKFLGFWRFSFVAIWYTMIILEPPFHHHFIKGVGAGGGEYLQRQFWNFLQKVEGSDFCHKKQEVGIIGGLI